MSNLSIILASSSIARKLLLQQIGITPTEILPADIDETPQKREFPNHLAERLAKEKALAVEASIDNAINLSLKSASFGGWPGNLGTQSEGLFNINESQNETLLNIDESSAKLTQQVARIASFERGGLIIIAADSVVSAGKRILPKALTNEDVEYCLNILSGRRHRVYTGLCFIKKKNGSRKILQRLVTTIVKFKRLTPSEIKYYITLQEGLNKAGGYGIQGYAASFTSFISGSHSNIIGLPLFDTINMLTSLGFNQK